MTAKEIVAELKKLGTPQTKKMWMTHGAQEPCLGVTVADMKKIQKRVKMDYQLALDLYDTGIADAMYLAGLIADDAKMTKKDLQEWVKNAAPNEYHSWRTAVCSRVPRPSPVAAQAKLCLSASRLRDPMRSWEFENPIGDVPQLQQVCHQTCVRNGP
jgi:hypothetical protein